MFTTVTLDEKFFGLLLILAVADIGYDFIKLPYDARCYFNVRSKADISRLNLPHGNDN